MASEKTTLKLSSKTKGRLDNLKEYRRESYDEILDKMLDILNTLKVSPEKARSKLTGIDRKNTQLKQKEKE